ncbi:hypothetical protein GCG21_13715 [Pseudactinotalea sp. HY160]|uniref:hypothetical protein n=1 Tax=Pseudactinotalea sp. HY160 TaxID=2654490 RepID=UPI00128CE6D4|nr:hypothetical protein [Pseudactinotalea sp. HY160]MPV51044.1 hypothetical protein [Pseudactinotalea sp. HY160]
MDIDTRHFMRRALAVSLLVLAGLAVWIIAVPNPSPDGRTVLAFLVAGVAIVSAFGAGEDRSRQ